MNGIVQGDSSRLLILVDDDEDDLILFRRALQKAGIACSILWVDQGSKAVEMLSRRGPEISSVCLVSDSQLPDMSGIELLKKVRGMALPILVKFAVLTANIQPGLENLARASGADAFFAKTCCASDLIQTARAIANL